MEDGAHLTVQADRQPPFLFSFLFFSSLSSKSEKADRVTNCPAKMKNTCNGNTIPWNVVAQCRFRFTEMLGIF